MNLNKLGVYKLTDRQLKEKNGGSFGVILIGAILIGGFSWAIKKISKRTDIQIEKLHRNGRPF